MSSATVRTLASVYKRSFTPDTLFCKTGPCPVPLIGYARISTEDQTALPQVQELRAAGSVEIVEEQARVAVAPGPFWRVC